MDLPAPSKRRAVELARNAGSQNPVTTSAVESFGVEAAETGNRAGGPGEVGQDGTMKGEERSYAVSGGLRARHALVVVTVVALSTGCSSSEPQAHVAPPVVPGIQLPVFEKSCAPQPGPASVVPIRVVSRL